RLSLFLLVFLRTPIRALFPYTTLFRSRAPNHLGDLVMALPALTAAPEADVLVARGLVPLLGLVSGFDTASDGEGVPGEGRGGARSGAGRRVIPFDRGWRGTARAA